MCVLRSYLRPKSSVNCLYTHPERELIFFLSEAIELRPSRSLGSIDYAGRINEVSKLDEKPKVSGTSIRKTCCNLGKDFITRYKI